MATQGDKVTWADITALYTKLNTARTKFDFAKVNPASKQGKIIQPDVISKINAFVSEMASNSNLKNIAKPVTVPAKETLIKPSFLNTLSNTVKSIQNADNFSNTSFGNSSFSNTGFGDSSWGNSSWGNSSWGNSSFGNSSFGFFGGGDGSHNGQAYG